MQCDNDIWWLFISLRVERLPSTHMTISSIHCAILVASTVLITMIKLLKINSAKGAAYRQKLAKPEEI